MSKKGSLIIVGSGIKGVGQISLETQAWIKQADIVHYCVADPVSEIWIKKNCKKSIDLYSLYGNDKQRIDTYNDMVESMLGDVRRGLDVCGVFYGHPGIFVLPSHKAIKIARSEGYKAAMLPAISALDCLYADVGVDPSTQGSQTYEATDMLMRKRPILTDWHVVVWQIGCVGDLGFNFGGYDNRNLDILVDYLLNYYQADQPVVHYQGSQYPVCNSTVERISLEELRNSRVTGISTLYIPPATQRKQNAQMLEKMGLVKKVSEGKYKRVSKSERAKKQAERAKSTPSQYSRYMPVPDNCGLAEFIMELSQNPALLAAFRRNPEATVRMYAEMTEEEEKALLTLHPGVIRMAIKNHREHPHLDHIHEANLANSNS